MTTITVSARTHSLVLTKSFAAKAAIFGTDEYKMLQEARRDYPGYKVTVGKTKEAKNIYAGLDYAYMEKYIAAHDDEEKTIYDEKKLISECHSKGFRYPVIKSWFLERFPEIKTFGVPVEEEAEIEAPVEAPAEAPKLALAS